MPISQQALTPTQFLDLQNNITDQKATFVTCATLAESGLTVVALLDEVAPTIDLAPGFAAHFEGIEQYDSVTNFVTIAGVLNSHIVSRGTVAVAGDTPSTRLNRWLAGTERVNEVDMAAIEVTQEYADISAAAGYTIDVGNIEP